MNEGPAGGRSEATQMSLRDQDLKIHLENPTALVIVAGSRASMKSFGQRIMFRISEIGPTPS